MSWVPVDDTLPWNRKLIGVSPRACWLLICCWCWCKHQGTDGTIPLRAMTHLATQIEHRTARLRAVSELQRAGFLERTETGWQCHDWLDYNDKASVIAARIAENRERSRKWRESRTANERHTYDERMAYERDTYSTKTETYTETKKRRRKTEGAPAPEPPSDTNGQPGWLADLPWRLEARWWSALLAGFPGLDHEAILRDAAAYWRDHPGKYRDGRRFVRSQLARAFARRAVEEPPVPGPVLWDCETCGSFHEGGQTRPACTGSGTGRSR